MILSRLRETYWEAFHTVSLKVLFLSCVLVFTGFTSSRALTSIGMIGIVVAALFNHENFSAQRFWGRKEILLLTVLFWGVFVTGLWSEDKNQWLNFTRIHLPYLFLPVAFALIPPLNFMQIKAIGEVYVSIMSLSSIAVLINYALHHDAINESIISGGVVPVPFSHIRYALMLVMAFCVALFFTIKQTSNQQKNSFEKYLLLASAILLFVTLHIISVRSGLLALYSCLIVVSGFWFAETKNWRLLMAIVIALTVFVIVSFRVFPSLKNRVNYMRHDLHHLKVDDAIDASDGMRFRSWKAAIEVAKQSPFLGVGYGDLQQEMEKYYNSNYPTLNDNQKKLPHNQWLWWLVSNGWFGVILFSTVILFPLFKYLKTSFWLWHCFYAIILTSFVWEATLEEQMGTGFFIVWVLLLLQYLSNSNES